MNSLSIAPNPPCDYFVKKSGAAALSYTTTLVKGPRLSQPHPEVTAPWSRDRAGSVLVRCLSRRHQPLKHH
ncbi:hypothetical protein E2C01_020591 [Portunus trituberculatus]|uniref:Uncharacterized protein n=1 Tax=Portunus trituberculatus TaxID=210409 RepID=A0A5B7E076_PORTR|nr:hypothetical protein [Portunus trituberculatus]